MFKILVAIGFPAQSNGQTSRIVPRKRSYSRVTRQALAMLGKLIRIGRIERGLTTRDLADRAGISRTTLSSVEKGTPGPEIGIVFELASIVGVRLFAPDANTLQTHDIRLDEKLSILPKSVRASVDDVDDDF